MTTQPKPTMEEVEPLLARIQDLQDREWALNGKDREELLAMGYFLLARVRELEHQQQEFYDNWHGVSRDCADLRTQLASAQEDSRRLDWLENHRPDGWPIVVIEMDPEQPSRVAQTNWSTIDCDQEPFSFFADTYREAIDAAREASEEEGT